jgi:hypothetical protein
MRAFPLLLLRAGRRSYRKAHGAEQKTGENQAFHVALPPMTTSPALYLAHVLVGEPVSTSPEHALE